MLLPLTLKRVYLSVWDHTFHRFSRKLKSSKVITYLKRIRFILGLARCPLKTNAASLQQKIKKFPNANIPLCSK